MTGWQTCSPGMNGVQGTLNAAFVGSKLCTAVSATPALT